MESDTDNSLSTANSFRPSLKRPKSLYSDFYAKESSNSRKNYILPDFRNSKKRLVKDFEKTEDAEPLSEADFLIETITEGNLLPIFSRSIDKKDSISRLLFKSGIETCKIISHELQDCFSENILFYPNINTHKFFDICFKNKYSRKYIKGQAGTGKSYSLALYVYLMRSLPQNRAFFIHNAAEFFANPLETVLDEFQFAFADEISSTPDLEEKINNISSSSLEQIQISVFMIFDWLLEICYTKKLHVFVIFDQTELLESMFASQEDYEDTLAYQIYVTFRQPQHKDNTTVFLVSSLMNEPMPYTEPDFLEICFYPEPVDEKICSQYFQDISKGCVSPDQIDTVMDLTQGNIGQISSILRLNKEGVVDLRTYCKTNLENIKNGLEKFMAEDLHRLFSMTTALQALHSDKNLGKKPIDETLIDRRFIIYNFGNPKIEALYPLVIKGLRDFILQSSELDKIIEQFRHDEFMLDFLFKNLIVHQINKWKNGLKKPLSLSKFNRDPTRDDFVLKNKIYHLTRITKDSFKENGIYVPMLTEFPLVDFYDVTSNEVTVFIFRRTLNEINQCELKIMQNLLTAPCIDKHDYDLTTMEGLYRKLTSFAKHGKEVKFILATLDEPKTLYSLKRLRDNNMEFYHLDAHVILNTFELERKSIKYLANINTKQIAYH